MADDEIGGLDGGDETFVLTSKDGKDFDVNKKNVMISKLISTMVEADTTATKVQVPAVDAKIMEHIVSYCNHHGGQEPPIIEKPLRSKVMADVVKDKWDAEFIDKVGEDLATLYELILAANYMDITGLLHLGCAKVASLIKGQPLEKIKDILSVEKK